MLIHALSPARRPVRTYPFDGVWLDIGRPADYAEAQETFKALKERILPGNPPPMTTPAAPITWKYPLSDISVSAEEEAAVLEVIRSKWLSMGPKTSAFEERLKSYVGSRYCLAVSNCTTGLHLAVASLGLGPGDEVIAPSLSFVATTNAILYTGATPVFTDIESLSAP